MQRSLCTGTPRIFITNVMRSEMCEVNNVVEQSKSSVLVFLKTESRRWSVVNDEAGSVQSPFWIEGHQAIPSHIIHDKCGMR